MLMSGKQNFFSFYFEPSRNLKLRGTSAGNYFYFFWVPNPCEVHPYHLKTHRYNLFVVMLPAGILFLRAVLVLYS